MPYSSPPSTENHCSTCHQVFADSSLLINDIWSCSAIKNYFLVGQNKRSLVCGFCGAQFHEWFILSKGDRHLRNNHRKSSCNRDKKFYEPNQFRQHLVEAHHGVPGWWLDSLERNAQCSLCRSCVPDTTISAMPDPRLDSISRAASLVSHHDDTDAGGVDMVRQPLCNTSRTNSMHRVHSDVSEYDAQGNLLKRTIMDSYTSVADDAAPALQRPRSSPGSQAHESARGLVTPHLFCFKCPDSSAFSGTIELTRHLCTEHSSVFVEARKHRRLKQAYGRQKKQLRWALDLLQQDVAKGGSPEERDATITDQITNALKELDLACQPGSGGGPRLSDSDSDSDSEGSGPEDNPHEGGRRETPIG
jgi:hypothetical protein